MIEELWKDIDGYESIYQISNHGRVKRIGTGHILNLADNKSGYYKVGLCKNSIQKWFYVHVLVAKAFVANPNGYTIVNHKDGDGHNNMSSNLEWCTMQYNAEYSHNMPVIIYKDKKFVTVAESCKEAEKIIGCSRSTIYNVLDGLPYNGFEAVKHDMTLSMMHNMQAKLQDRLGTMSFSSEKDRTAFIKHQAQYLDQELHEMLRELQFFKEWKQYEWTEDEVQAKWAAAQEELIDAFHFMLNICLALELTPDDISRIYLAKNNINHARQDGGY